MESETGREVLQQLILNAKVAKEQRIPFCQDTGYAVVCVELGQNVHIEACATHSASFPVARFPVAVNVDRHSHRGKEVVI